MLGQRPRDDIGFTTAAKVKIDEHRGYSHVVQLGVHSASGERSKSEGRFRAGIMVNHLQGCVGFATVGRASVIYESAFEGAGYGIPAKGLPQVKGIDCVPADI